VKLKLLIIISISCIIVGCKPVEVYQNSDMLKDKAKFAILLNTYDDICDLAECKEDFALEESEMKNFNINFVGMGMDTLPYPIGGPPLYKRYKFEFTDEYCKCHIMIPTKQNGVSSMPINVWFDTLTNAIVFMGSDDAAYRPLRYFMTAKDSAELLNNSIHAKWLKKYLKKNAEHINENKQTIGTWNFTLNEGNVGNYMPTIIFDNNHTGVIQLLESETDHFTWHVLQNNLIVFKYINRGEHPFLQDSVYTYIREVGKDKLANNTLIKLTPYPTGSFDNYSDLTILQSKGK